ncbi:superfamily I DNA RNA helicase [Levilactobacillus koreensis JCM 16448]|uniref:ATP-dependent DNA helicase n=1 Tax=Levilactobacillus koreensis TaxID=637971 RepID=A0AAC8UU88_9LACO|nr:RNA polymerase recycling motor HelD [Levilactobacillus koreensis]AKP63992.1 ATP-dependent DNA helicase [Levilactobacillus koreensis]KRK86412.1 superfamily I DNA RNA helicase [Levilactobacillus koreensis JCM 16448]
MTTSEQAEEQQRVDQVADQIGERIDKTVADYTAAHKELRNVLKNYSENTSVNWFEVDDRIETSAELQQQRALVSRLTENQNIIEGQLDTYKELQKSPYFGRIDIQDPGESQPESLYIGTASFVDEDQNFLVYDWRAPVSSIYYNGVLGEVAYSTPAGDQETNLLKKRQFLIQDGQIESMFDTNETVGDKMLQHALGEQNDATMQNIVSTIQREQNDIIRDTKSDLLVVQGVAGSGKTSAILQRIAFLLYHSRRDLEADQIVLFSPNRLFSHYISDVLPSLGERNMRQVTLAEFLTQRFQGLNVQTQFERYEEDQQTPVNLPLRNFRESAAMMTAVNDYCHQVSPAELQFTDIRFKGRVFFDKEEIRDIYSQFPAATAPADRFLRTKNELEKRLKHRIHEEAKADWVRDTIDQLSDEDYHNLLGEKHLGKFEQLDDEIDFIARQIVRRRLRQVDDAIYNGYFLDAYSQYTAFLKQCPLPDDVSATDWQTVIDAYQHDIEYHKLALTDAAPLLYLRDILAGGGANHRMQHLFVDEMQDYSMAQLIYLQHAFPRAKLTLLGDSEQALFKAVESPESILKKLDAALNVKRSRLITLRRSYRSTLPITTFAKALLPDGDQIEAFNRPGDLPKVVIRYDNESAFKALAHELRLELATNGTVAILTKSTAEAKYVYQELHAEFDLTRLTDTDRSLPKGIVVLPIYLAKGLEFDSVIAYNVSAENYPDDQLTGTLYTIASRAMHHLTLLSIGAASPLIASDKIPQADLTIEHEFQN